MSPMFFIQKQYAKFLKSSSNEHGVHSPFVYNLIKKCIYASAKKSDKKNLKNYCKALLKVEEYTELHKSERLKKKSGLLLMRMLTYLNIKDSLEIGGAFGVSSFCLTNTESVLLTSIENNEHAQNTAIDLLPEYNKNSISYLAGDIKGNLQKVTKDKNYDLIYFGGSCTEQEKLDYFKDCLKAKHNDSVFVFNAIHSTPQMVDMWKEIKNHKEVSVTLDLFNIGLVFFRKEQVEEHFIIRH